MNSIKHTSKLFSIILIVCAVLGTAVPFFIKQYNLVLLSTYLSIPMLTAAIVWLSIQKNEFNTLNNQVDMSSLYILIFLIFYLISIIVLNFYDIRTTFYYFLVALMGVLILAQILLSNDIDNQHNQGLNADNSDPYFHIKSGIILFQIIMLFINIIYGVNLKYYFFIGRTDVFFHSWAIENLLHDGFINQTFDVYEAFPLWHILCTFISQATGLTVIPARIMFLVNGFIYGFLIIVIYLIASKFFNIKIALLSSLFLCFNTEALFYGMYSIPRSVIFFLEALFILLLFYEKTIIYKFLCIIIIIGLIMYHTASMPFIIFILTLFYIMQMIYRINKNERIINFGYILLILIMTLTYWMFAGVKVFNSVIGSLFEKASDVVLTKSIVITPLSELFNYLQYSPLLLFIIIGVMWGIHSSWLNESSKAFLLLSLFLVPVTLPGPALLINKLAGNFNLARFGEYTFLFISIAGAVGIYTLFYYLKKFKVFVILLFFIMAFLTVSNDFTASDNPLVKRPFYTYYFNEEEIVSINRAAKIANGYLMSDYICCRYLENTEFADKVHVLEVGQDQKKLLKSKCNDIILIREKELLKRPVKLFTSPNDKFVFEPSLSDTLDYYYNDSIVWDSLNHCNQIYDSGSIKLYQ